MKVNLSDAEWKVMRVLWESSPRTITEITRSLEEEKGFSKHTIITYLKRMEEKGAVYYKEGEKAKQYYPNIKEEDTAIQETEEFLDKVFHGRMGLMLNAMVSSKALSKQDLDDLYQILEKERNK